VLGEDAAVVSHPATALLLGTRVLSTGRVETWGGRVPLWHFDASRRLIPDPALQTRRQPTRVFERRGPIPHEGAVARHDDNVGASQVLVATTVGRTAGSVAYLV